MEVIDLKKLFCQQCTGQIGCACKDEDGVREFFVSKFARALESSGFVQIVGHGVDESTVHTSVKEAQQFFRKSSQSKDFYISKDKARRGYSPTSTENFASLIGVGGKPNDLVQKYRIGPVINLNEVKDDPYYSTKEGRIHFYPNNEEELIETFPVSSTDYYQSMERLAKQLMKLILFCSNVSPSSFDSSINKHTSILSLNYYDALCADTTESSEPLMRVEAHTDVSLFTIVAQSAQNGTDAGALQVFMQKEGEDNGEFVTVPYVPGALVVNVGDCLHDWSQGRYRSALHRVVNLPTTEPESRETGSSDSVDHSRVSLAYFFAPNYDAVMKWPDSLHATPIDTTHTPASTDYSTWRKNHIKKSMQQLKKNIAKSV